MINSQKSNRIKHIFKNILVLFTSLIMTCIALEISFRVFAKVTGVDEKDYPLNLDYEISSYLPHPFLVYTLKPNLKKWLFHTNSHGYRGREFNLIKDEKVFRIVCIGESTTFGFNSAEKDTFPRQLEAMLQKKLPQKIEIINAGVSSYTSAENVINFIFNIIPLKPDLVISHQGVNDVRPRAYPGFRSDYAHYRKIWRVPVLRTFVYNIMTRTYFISKHSLLYRFLLFRLLAPYNSITSYTDKSEWLGIDHQPAGKLAPHTISAFERNIKSIAVLSKANNIKLLFATIPFNHNKDYQKIVPKYVQGIYEHNQVVKKIARVLMIPIVNLDFLMTGVHDYFRDIVHVNKEGDKLKAEYIYSSILTNNLISE